MQASMGSVVMEWLALEPHSTKVRLSASVLSLPVLSVPCRLRIVYPPLKTSILTYRLIVPSVPLTTVLMVIWSWSLTIFKLIAPNVCYVLKLKLSTVCIRMNKIHWMNFSEHQLTFNHLAFNKIGCWHTVICKIQDSEKLLIALVKVLPGETLIIAENIERNTIYLLG